jgi:hypothetical protein
MGREFILDKRKFKQLKNRDVSMKQFWNRQQVNVQVTMNVLPDMGDRWSDWIQLNKAEAKELAKFLNEWVEGREPEGY